MGSNTQSGRLITAREVIDEIVDHMEENKEPFVTKVLAPSLYLVRIHRDVYDRLAPVREQLEEEAGIALSLAIQRVNEANLEKSRSRNPFRRKDGSELLRHQPASNFWDIQMIPHDDESFPVDDVEVSSILAVQENPDFGSGTPTVRISRTSRVANNASATFKTMYAQLVCYDQRGTFPYEMENAMIVVGREVPNKRVDLPLKAEDKVSREHLAIRYLPGTGFEIQDRSVQGTWVDKKQIPAPYETDSGELVEAEWVSLPKRSTISLAKSVTIQFTGII